MNNRFYIWSHEREAFWLASCYGYTQNVQEAGKFSLETASQICIDANWWDLSRNNRPNETMIPVE